MISSRFNTKSRFQSPPRAASTSLSSQGNTGIDIADAKVQEKSRFGWAKVGIGLGLAAGALAGCGEPVPPAAEAGAYELESPEVVVMDAALDRIDLARETEEICTGFGEDEVCVDHDVAYHSVGIHVGHGVVQDLNGNLFAAPQLAAEGAGGLAVSNPSNVTVKAPVFAQGRMTQLEDGTFETSGLMFGNHTISIDGNNAVVESPSLFGRYESMRVSNHGGVATISEGGGWEQQRVQSQGDYLLVQNSAGWELGQIRQDSDAGSYSLKSEALFGDQEFTVSYGDGNYSRNSNAWGGSPFTGRTNTDENGETTVATNTGFMGSRYETTVTNDGWSTKVSGFLGGTTTYSVQGGEMLTGS